MKVYTQRTRKDGDVEMGRAWSEGVSSHDRNVIIDNIMETIERKHSLNDEDTDDCFKALRDNGRCHVDTTTYDIGESEE